MSKEELFRTHQSLALKIADVCKLDYEHEIEDIKQIALLGLWRAALTYELFVDGPFCVYATKNIIDEIYDYINSIKNSKMRTISIQTRLRGFDNVTIEDTLESECYSPDEIMYLIGMRELRESINRVDHTSLEKTIWDLVRQGASVSFIAKRCDVSELYVKETIEELIKKISDTYKR